MDLDGQRRQHCARRQSRAVNSVRFRFSGVVTAGAFRTVWLSR